MSHAASRTAPTRDAYAGSDRAAFAKVRNAETDYGRRLRMVAKQVEELVRAFAQPGMPVDVAHLADMLDRYSVLIAPWARAVASRFVAEVSRRDEAAWARYAKGMSRALAEEIRSAPTGELMRIMLDEQVRLITSLPVEAARRVHDLAVGNLYGGERYNTIVDELLRTGLVTRNRATLIARTETGRVSSALTAARATNIGCEFGIWRTVRDRRVRSAHKRMEGHVFRISDPPEVEPGKRYLPGGIYNCFPGDTVVSLENGLNRIWRAWFDGDLVGLVLNDETIFVTPNHPILTGRGWMAASAISQGDYLVCQPNNIVGRPYTDKHDKPLTFDEIFGSFVDVADIVIATGGLFDFHGDVLHGDIYEIRPDRKLMNSVKAILSQETDEFSFSYAEMGMGCSFRSRPHHTSLVTGSSSSGLDADLFWRSARSGQLVGFTGASEHDTVPLQMVGYDTVLGIVSPTYSSQPHASVDVGVHDFVNRYISPGPMPRSAAVVDCDTALLEPQTQGSQRETGSGGSVFYHATGFYDSLRVVDKVSRRFSGHVYTMETNTGYYPVGRIRAIAKNCRCYMEPVIPDRYQPGKVPA